MNHNSTNGVEGAAVPPSPASDNRLCASCDTPLTPARLKAQPCASQCVPCLEAAGDVLKTQRYDEQVGEEIIPTYFRKASSYLQATIIRAKGATGFRSLTEENN